jgi:hypothetical protein
MKDDKNDSPPKWAARLLSWYCKPELLEDLQGDLNEYFDRNVKKKGARDGQDGFMFLMCSNSFDCILFANQNL